MSQWISDTTLSLVMIPLDAWLLTIVLDWFNVAGKSYLNAIKVTTIGTVIDSILGLLYNVLLTNDFILRGISFVTPIFVGIFLLCKFYGLSIKGSAKVFFVWFVLLIVVVSLLEFINPVHFS